MGWRQITYTRWVGVGPTRTGSSIDQAGSWTVDGDIYRVGCAGNGLASSRPKLHIGVLGEQFPSEIAHRGARSIAAVPVQTRTSGCYEGVVVIDEAAGGTALLGV